MCCLLYSIGFQGDRGAGLECSPCVVSLVIELDALHNRELEIPRSATGNSYWLIAEQQFVVRPDTAVNFG